jgi:F0F1-type ATP synthase membrane subunit b/b'
MFAFILFLLAGGGSGSGEWSNFWNHYLNYPGFEAWKFVNLAIFVGLMIYLLKKPLSETFKAKREEIRAELIKAEQEKQAAMSQLTEVEAKMARLDTEKQNILNRAKEEANAEEKRIASETEKDINKIREQADNEVLRTANQAKQELRKLSAEETIRLAEETLRGKLGGKNDADLVRVGINSLGGAK